MNRWTADVGANHSKSTPKHCHGLLPTLHSYKKSPHHAVHAVNKKTTLSGTSWHPITSSLCENRVLDVEATESSAQIFKYILRRVSSATFLPSRTYTRGRVWKMKGRATIQITKSMLIFSIYRDLMHRRDLVLYKQFFEDFFIYLFIYLFFCRKGCGSHTAVGRRPTVSRQPIASLTLATSFI